MFKYSCTFISHILCMDVYVCVCSCACVYVYNRIVMKYLRWNIQKLYLCICSLHYCISSKSVEKLYLVHNNNTARRQYLMTQQQNAKRVFFRSTLIWQNHNFRYYKFDIQHHNIGNTKNRISPYGQEISRKEDSKAVSQLFAHVLYKLSYDMVIYRHATLV
jgi:hypothetical protein